MLSASPLSLLTGCTVGWIGRDGKMNQGEVTAYRYERQRLVLQILLPNDKHIWMFSDVVEDTYQETFCVLQHGPSSLDYGLDLADQIMNGIGSIRPINVQLTTLAATCLALEAQLKNLTEKPDEVAADTAVPG